MRKNNLFFYFFSIFVCFSSPLAASAQTPVGYGLCRALSDFLTEQNIPVQETPLLSADGNEFPFNISADFPSDKPSALTESSLSAYSNPEFLTDFIISLSAEDAYAHKEYTAALVNALSSAQKKCTVRLIFTYGDESRLHIPDKITGTEVFLSSLINKNRASAVCVRFSDGKNAVIPGGAGDTAPSWLTQLVADAFYKCEISYELKGGFISSLYRINFLHNDARTSQFLKEEIPAAGIELNTEKISAEKTADFFTQLVSAYNPEETTEWDRHTNQFVLGKKIIWTSEKLTTILFLAVTFFSLLAFSELSPFAGIFSLSTIRPAGHTWYLIPLTVLATTLSFLIGQGISFLLYRWFFIDNFTKIAIKLFTGFLLISLYFQLLIKIRIIRTPASYDYFVTIAGIINIFLFSCIDISLFYLFTAEYSIIYLSHFSKNAYSQAIFFFLLLVPLMPYSVQLIKYISPEALPRIIDASFFINLIIACGFLPFEFLWLNMLVRLNRRWKKSNVHTKRFIKQNVAAVIGAVGIFAVILITVTAQIPDKYKAVRKDTETVFIRRGTEDALNVSFRDYHFFGDTARVISIQLENQCESCTVSIKGDTAQPVLYSDNLYTANTRTRTDSFRLPAFPPEKMQFSYISNNATASTITVSAIIPYSEENGAATETTENNAAQTFSYKLYKKDIFIPAQTDSGDVS